MGLAIDAARKARFITDWVLPHTPGPDVEVIRFLIEERDIIGFGSEAIGTDAGQGGHRSLAWVPRLA